MTISTDLSPLRALLAAKIIAPNELEERAALWRADKKTLATCNGCFDVLHPGHLHILSQAAQQADVLLLALNVDAVIARSKGPKRPYHALNERLLIAASLQFVDFVTYFAEATPVELLRIVRPDVHVNGAEYGADCVEAPILREIGARLHLVESIPGYSTSRLLRQAKDGAIPSGA